MLSKAFKTLQSTINTGITNIKQIVNNVTEKKTPITINKKVYYQIKQIAEGGYSYLYKILRAEDEREFALKKIFIQNDNHKKQIKSEITNWKLLSSYGNIVELVDYEIHSEMVLIVMEYCPEGTLLDYIRSKKIDEKEAIKILFSILQGLGALHSQDPSVIHMDLKIENILKKGNTYKLCDFGSSTREVFDPKSADDFTKEEHFSHYEKHSTLYYRAPEMCDKFAEKKIGPKVDIWALGCLVYCMLFKMQPFEGAQKLEIISGQYDFPEAKKMFSEKMLDLVRNLLTPDPDERPDINKVMEWVGYWDTFSEIPLTQGAKDIKKRQEKNGKKKGKMISQEEMEKMRKKLKNKEKEDEKVVEKSGKEGVNLLDFGFSNNNNNANNNNGETNTNDDFDFFAVDEGNNNTNNNNPATKKDDFMGMDFFSNNNNTNTVPIKQEQKSDLPDIFGDFQSPNPNNNGQQNPIPQSQKNDGIDLLDDMYPKQSQDSKKPKKESIDLLGDINPNQGSDLLSLSPNSKPAMQTTQNGSNNDFLNNFKLGGNGGNDLLNMPPKGNNDFMDMFSKPNDTKNVTNGNDLLSFSNAPKENVPKVNNDNDLLEGFNLNGSEQKQENNNNNNQFNYKNIDFSTMDKPNPQKNNNNKSSGGQDILEFF